MTDTPNISNNKVDKDISIFNNNATSQTKYLICGGCVTAFPVCNCNKRTCAVCQERRRWRLYKKNEPRVKEWIVTDNMKIQHLTLTCKNVPEISLEYIKKRDKQYLAFKKRLERLGYRFEEGFDGRECTYHKTGDNRLDENGNVIGVYSEADCGYHYHYHLLFYGAYIDLKNPVWNLSKIWEDVTGDSKFVKLRSKFKSGNKALKYILKYVAKGNFNAEESSVYIGIIKNKRLFNSFGKNYGKSKKIEKRIRSCPECGMELMKNHLNFDSYFFSWIPHNMRDQIKIKMYDRLRAWKIEKGLLMPVVHEKTPEEETDALNVILNVCEKEMDIKEFKKKTHSSDIEIAKWRFEGLIFHPRPNTIMRSK